MASSVMIKKLASSLVVICGLGWVVYLLASSIRDIPPLALNGILPLILASLFVLGALLLNVFPFFLLLNAGGGGGLSFFSVARMHFFGQILRYLPGRLWGVVYQASIAPENVSKIRLARANVDWMLLSMSVNAVAASLIIAASLNISATLIAVIGLVGGAALLLVPLGGLDYLLVRLTGIMSGRIRRVMQMTASTPLSLTKSICLLTTLLLSWGSYTVGWCVLSYVFPVFANIDMIDISAAYTLASVVGIVSVVAPAGLGVREASFMLIASGMAPSQTLAFFAVFGRVWLMSLDVFLFVTSFLCFRLSQDKNESRG